MTGMRQLQNELRTVYLDDSADALIILDQTQLPQKEVYLALQDLHAIHEAIVRLKVRGAPAIGITAAYGAYLAIKKCGAADYPALRTCFLKARQYLASSRPTAVNLSWALNRMEECFDAHRNSPAATIVQVLKTEADRIFAEDAVVCQSIGEHGLKLLKPGDGLLTHCNAGCLATSRLGTALAPIYLGHSQGYAFKVYADETRPLLQGARLTAFELQRAGIDVTLICDNMAASVMQKGWVQAVLVGCDRVAANGDTANKIGTAGLAVLAHHFHIPFYVCAPLSTIDLKCKTGKQIDIEQRPAEEVCESWYRHRMAPPGITVYNPAFDVTGHKLVSAFITEKGIVRPPFGQGLAGLFQGS